mgnify:CR=1 FL=1
MKNENYRFAAPGIETLYIKLDFKIYPYNDDGIICYIHIID